MAKKRRSISDKRVGTLLRRISKIKTNYIPNMMSLRGKLNSAFQKSSTFKKTPYTEDFDVFNDIYNDIMINPKRLKTSKDAREQAMKFINKYEPFTKYNKKTLLRKTSIMMRDEYLSHFKELGLDTDLLDTIKLLGLWDNVKFWQGFFNSKYFVPLYQDYKPTDLQYMVTHIYRKGGRGLRRRHKQVRTRWGTYIEDYLKEWIKKNG